MQIRLLTSFSGLLLFAMLNSASAQPSRGRGGPPPGPFGEAVREVMRERGGDVLGLLHSKAVREEIKLPDQNWQLIQEDLRQTFQILQQVDPKDKTKEQLVEEIRQAVAPTDTKILDTLKQSGSYDRLLELFVQAFEYQAAANKEIADRIGLEGDNLLEFRSSRDDAWRKSMRENDWRIREKIRKGERISHVFHEIEKDVNAALKKRLTPEQLASLQELRGKEFEDKEELHRARAPRGGPMRGESRERARGGDKPEDDRGDSHCSRCKPNCSGDGCFCS